MCVQDANAQLRQFANKLREDEAQHSKLRTKEADDFEGRILQHW